MLDIIVGTAVGAIIGGAIGTYGGAYLVNKEKKEKNEKLRDLAISALNLFKKYAKDDNSFKKVEADFNNTFNISQKRAFLVLLHKLGIPILVPVGQAFKIEDIHFSSDEINKDSLAEMIIQVKNGYCDELFYVDVDKYYNSELIIKSKRDIAFRYINEVMLKTTLNKSVPEINFPSLWHENFSIREFNLILVFRKKNLDSWYYTRENNIDIEKVEKLKDEVRLGLWDEYLDWDFDSYSNLIAQKNSADIIATAIQLSQQSLANNTINTFDNKEGNKYAE